MAKTAKGTAETRPATDHLSYGEAVARLESIVGAMEEEDLPLEQLLTRYEEGRRLVQLCQGRLAAAELRIRQLEEDAAGNLEAPPLTLDPEPSPDA
ncbi:MAG: exodeoxyribonuclease VII small subunit [Verrucomicrobiales bacterium]|nr:exodeoxyribonuclease VII small subunit [Verrucomicrobiales bacterium]MCP5526651.1 exodeoxyribonuclease VII small subunit [Verrucomicrobiales bacterium]